MLRELIAVSEVSEERLQGSGRDSVRNCSDRTRGNGYKLKEREFNLGIRNKFFTVRMARHWNRLPRQVVNTPTLAVSKARLDRALSSLVQWEVFLPMASGLGPDDL